MFDDYGNMLLSTGLAHQQRPQEMQGLQRSQEELTQYTPIVNAPQNKRTKPSTVQMYSYETERNS